MLPFRKPGAGVPLYPSMPLVGTPLILGNGAGEYVPPELIIDAPTEVTYIDETNPPSFNMVISETGDGAVEVGDEPQKRYDGAGTIYTGDPIDAIPATQPLGGFGDSALSDGATGYVQFRFRRDDGLGGYVYSDWSSSGEGAYEIPVPDTAPDAFTAGQWSVADLASGGDIRVTITALPDDGGSAITDIEYRIDAGSWVSSGTSTTGTFDVSGLTDDVEVTVELRAVNAIGNGPDSDDKTVTPTGAAWSPADEAPGTFTLWLDGADSGTFTMDTGTVVGWADKSGAGNNATVTFPGPLLASGGGVLFTNSGSKHLVCALSASNDDEAVFMVVKTPSSLASPAAVMGASGANGRELRVNGGELSMVRLDTEEEAITSGLSLPTSTLMLIEMQLDFGAQTVMGRDGTLQTSTGLHDTAFTAGRTSYIGAKQPNLEPWGDGEIKEILVLPTKPGSTLATKIRNYLNAAWGL